MKSIQLSQQNWERLQGLRVKGNFRSLDDLMTLILEHTKESIKKGDLEIIKEKKK